MEILFVEIFNRRLTPQELIILRRLRKLYGEDLVIEAIRLSVHITEGSPVRYISAVANNLFKESQQNPHKLIKQQTQERLEALKKYGTS